MHFLADCGTKLLQFISIKFFSFFSSQAELNINKSKISCNPLLACTAYKLLIGIFSLPVGLAGAVSGWRRRLTRPAGCGEEWGPPSRNCNCVCHHHGPPSPASPPVCNISTSLRVNIILQTETQKCQTFRIKFSNNESFIDFKWLDLNSVNQIFLFLFHLKNLLPFLWLWSTCSAKFKWNPFQIHTRTAVNISLKLSWDKIFSIYWYHRGMWIKYKPVYLSTVQYSTVQYRWYERYSPGCELWSNTSPPPSVPLWIILHKLTSVTVSSSDRIGCSDTTNILAPLLLTA